MKPPIGNKATMTVQEAVNHYCLSRRKFYDLLHQPHTVRNTGRRNCYRLHRGTRLCFIGGQETEGKIQAKTSFIKSLKADVDILLSKETDSEVRDALRKLSDEIRFSDPMSNNALDNIEAEISDKLISVSAAGENKKNVISEISGLIKQRNIKCKALK